MEGRLIIPVVNWEKTELTLMSAFMLFSIYREAFSKWIDRHQTLLKNKMATQEHAQPWAMSKYRQIGFLMEAGHDVDPSEYQNNPDRINKLIREGVVYKDKKKKYWVDDKDQDCFAIYARGLDITNSDRPVYWQWMTDSDGIEMAHVVKTRWLEVSGSFWTMNLSPNARYKVSFQMKMASTSSTMKGLTVNLKLSLPDGTNQERQGQLPESHDSWGELEVGQFTMTAQNVGKMEFTMDQLFGRWTHGLIIKCVEIKPV